jgi:putative DNA primase/helicase
VANLKRYKVPPCTDAGNAELFANLYKNRLRYDHKRHRWLVWREHWWTEDSDQEVMRLAKQTARHRYRHVPTVLTKDERKQQANWALESESLFRLKAALTLAESEPSLSHSQDWDGNPWLLGVANGVLDLRTGRLRIGRQSDRITLHTDVAFDAHACCPVWERTLSEIFDCNAEVIAFVQRAVGYSLSGDMAEQCLFLCHGEVRTVKARFSKRFASYSEPTLTTCPSPRSS